MNLGVVNEIKTEEGTPEECVKVNLITDPLIIEVCKETLGIKSTIMVSILKHFGEILMLYGEKSQSKGNAFELVVLSNCLSEFSK